MLGEADGQLFSDELTRRGLRPEDYLPLPAHPWQWDEVILPGYHPAMARGELLPIGPLTDSYLPQQSIRTLSNRSDPSRLSLKLAMNLVNTSTSRVLAPHTVQNAPVINDWLLALVERTDWPEPMARPVLLREVAGVSFTSSAPAHGQYGALACIWRESVHNHLQPGEAAVPMTAFCRPVGKALRLRTMAEAADRARLATGAASVVGTRHGAGIACAKHDPAARRRAAGARGAQGLS